MSDPDTLGAELLAARVGRDLTLAQVERQTRIRAHYLAALEENNYAALPSAVQGRGFLRNYARFLGLDVEECERRFNLTLYSSSRRGRAPVVFADDPTLQSIVKRPPTSRAMSNPPPKAVTATAGSRTSSRSTATMPVAPTSRTARPDPRTEARRSRTRNMTLGTLGIVGASLVVLTLILLYTNHAFGVAAPISPIMSPLPSTETPTATLTPSITSTPDRPTPLPVPAISGTPSAATGLALQITVRERAPLRIGIDDQVVYSGVPAANTVLKYQAKNSVQIHSGDAGSIDISINGIAQPPIGEVHAIADKTYTLANIVANVAPTSTVLPTNLPGVLPTDPNAALTPTATLFIASKP